MSGRCASRWWTPAVALIVVCLGAGGARSPVLAAAYPDPPQALFKDLFVAVQAARIFSDGKAFPDAVPRSAPGDILAAYQSESPRSKDALRRFVETHFTLPSEVSTAPSS